jgi:hypothetical protein
MAFLRFPFAKLQAGISEMLKITIVLGFDGNQRMNKRTAKSAKSAKVRTL